MKTIKTAMILALTLMTATQAVASNCDLTVVPEIIERQNPITIRTFKGKRDWVGASAGKIARIALGSLLPIPLGITFGVLSLDPQNQETSRGHHPQQSLQWYARQYSRLTAKCNEYIRENFPEDFLVPGSPNSVAAHYYCGEPYQYHVTSRRIRPAVDLMYATPVYAEISAEQAIAMKCEKLAQCIVRSNNATELEQLQQTQIQLGCQ